MTFREFVTGKSVALVACGAYLMGSRDREIIESHDLVVRINKGFPVPEELVPDIGERTDILYHLLTVHIAASEQEFRQCVGKIGFIMSVQPSGHSAVPKFEHLNQGRIPFECVPLSLWQHVKLQVRKSPNSGVIAITHLLQQPIKSLYLTGFSFYQDGYYIGYGRRNAQEAAKMKGGQSGHDQHSQKLFIKNLLAKTTIPIEMDKTMQLILDNALGWEDQAIIFEKKKDGLVELQALMTMRHGQQMIPEGERFLVEKELAKQFLAKRRAILT